MSKKKWGKSTVKTERIIRDAVPKQETLDEIDGFLSNATSVTAFDLARRFNIRMSIAKDILSKKQEAGELVPYLKEAGFAVYTRPEELEKRETERPIMVSEVLEEVASSVPEQPVIDDEMDLALAAAGGAVKPSKIARKRREAGKKKERERDRRPEVVVEPLEEEPEATPPVEPRPEPKKEKPKKEKPKKEEVPKKKPKPEKKEPKPKKKAEPSKPPKGPAADIPLEELPGVGGKTRESLIKAGYKSVSAIADAYPSKIADEVDGVGEATANKMIDAAKVIMKDYALEELPGVGEKTRTGLREAGYKSISKIASADAAELSESVDGVGEATAKKIIKAAKKMSK
jgi:ribosomal protein S25